MYFFCCIVEPLYNRPHISTTQTQKTVFRLRAINNTPCYSGIPNLMVRSAFIMPNLCQSLPFTLTGGISYFAVWCRNELCRLVREQRNFDAYPPLSPAVWNMHLSNPHKIHRLNSIVLTLKFLFYFTFSLLKHTHISAFYTNASTR